jgi:SAM-dependent methyltransferase
MSDFYAALSPFYSRLFPVGPDKTSAYRRLLSGCRRILDVACGTGELARRLADSGRRVVALDRSEELLEPPRPGFHPVVGAMEALPFARDVRFDAILCLGNSLPHLPSLEAIDALLRTFHRLAADGGRVILQFLDLSRLPVEGWTLPEKRVEVEGVGPVALRRRYRPGPSGRSVFQPELGVAGRWRTFRIEMIALDPLHVIGRAERAGFAPRTIAVDESGRPWRPGERSVWIELTRTAEG